MTAKLLTPEQLAGGYEKLKRADQNILNLSVEISAFLNEGSHPGVARDKMKATEEWIKFLGMLSGMGQADGGEIAAGDRRRNDRRDGAGSRFGCGHAERARLPAVSGGGV